MSLKYSLDGLFPSEFYKNFQKIKQILLPGQPCHSIIAFTQNPAKKRHLNSNPMKGGDWKNQTRLIKSDDFKVKMAILNEEVDGIANKFRI